MKKLLLFFLTTSLFHINMLSAQETLIHDGTVREYFVHVPTNYEADESWPLVINMHGYGSSRVEQMLYSGFNAIADANNFLVVYPQGLPDALGTAHFNAYFSPSDIDDVGFIDQLIDQLYTDYNLDLKRVYSTGMSNGGFMSYRLACELPERIAAIASVTGSMLTIQVDNCEPMRPIPTMQIHGTEDETVPFAYEPNFFAFGEGIADVVGYWVNNNSCEGSPDTVTIEDINAFDESTASLLTWSDCGMDTEVQFYIVDNGGHTWPGAFPIATLGNTNADFFASQVIWDFFSRFEHPDPKAGTLLSTTSFQAVQDIEISPNPFQDVLRVEGEVLRLELYDAVGKLVQVAQFQNTDAHLLTTNLKAGVYLLSVETKAGKRVYKVVK
ncbi:MAG: T9SS type A sorting domain-containing protein [Bacteroidota bacterium]